MNLLIGEHYRLRHEVKKEHQDHLFTYPCGLLLQLESIEVVDWKAEDDPVVVCHFVTVEEGMSEVFAPEDVWGFDPATEPHVTIEP